MQKQTKRTQTMSGCLKNFLTSYKNMPYQPHHLLSRIPSPFRYPGGKSKSNIQKKIFSKFPATFKEYREPFIGGGGIFFAVNPKSVEKRWINDINEDLISVYKAFRDRPDEFIDMCRKVPSAQPGEPEVYPRDTSSGKKYNKRLKDIFDSVKYDKTCDQAFRYFFINRTVWGGRVNYDPKMESRMYFSNPNGWNIVDSKKLEQAAERLQGTKITVSSYEELLEADGEDVLIYCDPPYVVNTNLSRTDQLYASGFTDDDHIRFCKAVQRCKHKVVISYDDNADIRELFGFNNFVLHEVEWSYCGTSSDTKTIGKELIITNFE